MDIKEYMLSKKEDIKSLKVYPRDISIKPSKEFVSSIVGPRRAGKTYFLYDLILNKLKLHDEDYVFINFEDEWISNYDKKSALDVIKNHVEIYGKTPEYLFFDEVQNLEGWETIVYTFYETKRYNIFITGSSSKLLSKEISTQLRGRSINYAVFPFSFKEILNVKGFSVKEYYSAYEKGRLLNILNEYLQKGGYPQIYLTEVEPKLFFESLLEAIFYRDIIERYKIREPSVLGLLIKFLSGSFSAEFSLNKTYNVLKTMGMKISKKTIYSYTKYLENSFLIFFIRNFSPSVRNMELVNKKVYFFDSGLVNSLTGIRIKENYGRLMENAVALKLKKDEYRAPMNVYYYKNLNSEIDFIIKEGNHIKQLIQVSYANNFDEVDKREYKALLNGYELFKEHNPELLVITWDYEGEKLMDNKKIKFIPLWKWLLE